MRIGHGFDVHAFGPGNHIVLGGVAIPHDHGLMAHSDGDVLVHALCDALLGAAAMGDIGRHFPDNDPAWEGVDSRVLLRQVRQWLAERGWQLANADITVIAQAPRLAAHVDAMVENLSADLGCITSCINVKATTSEKLGFIGRKEGIACHAVVLLMPLAFSADEAAPNG